MLVLILLCEALEGAISPTSCVAPLLAVERNNLVQGVTTLGSSGKPFEVCSWEEAGPPEDPPRSAGFF